jgi:hypothetical protein
MPLNKAMSSLLAICRRRRSRVHPAFHCLRLSQRNGPQFLWGWDVIPYVSPNRNENSTTAKFYVLFFSQPLKGNGHLECQESG